MNEIFPVLAGAVAGGVAWRFVSGWLHGVVLVALCVVIGLAASLASGELALSWGFFPIDIFESLVIGALTFGAIEVGSRRTARV